MFITLVQSPPTHPRSQYINIPQFSISYNSSSQWQSLHTLNCSQLWEILKNKLSVISPLYIYSRSWYIIIERTKPYSIVSEGQKGKLYEYFTILSQALKSLLFNFFCFGCIFLLGSSKTANNVLSVWKCVCEINI